MNRTISYSFLILFLIFARSASNTANAQMPQCNHIYIGYAFNSMTGSDSLFNYDPSLPVSATNPSLNTIQLPHNWSGLTISEVPGSGGNALTYYTSVNGTYWYYNQAINSWVNTGHSYGSTNAVNFGAGGGYIYSMSGLGFGTSIYKYDGTGNAVFLRSISFPRPFDLVADCQGNFYVISLIGPMWSMTKFDSDGNVLQGYTVSNPNNYSLSGGLAIMGNELYSDDNVGRAIAHASISGANVVFDSLTAQIPYMLAGYNIWDMASCAAAVSGLPSVTVIASDTNVCAGTAVTFMAISSNAGSNAQYQWLVNGVSQIGATNSNYTYSPANNDLVTVQLTDNSGCSNITATSVAIPIKVLPMPSAEFLLPQSACVGDAVAATVNIVSAAVYQWNFGSAFVVNGSNTGPYTLRWDTAGQYTVTLQAIEGACQSEPFSMDISVSDHPSIQLSAANDNICSGDTIELTAITEEGNMIRWLPGAGYTLLQNNTGSAMLSTFQSASVPVTVTDPTGCSTTDSIQIATHSCCKLAIPGAFTPNGDNLNDLIKPLPGNYQVLSFMITNRWGQVVFASAGQMQGWDGTFNGKPQELGTYFYSVQYSCRGTRQTFQQHGDIQLIR